MAGVPLASLSGVWTKLLVSALCTVSEGFLNLGKRVCLPRDLKAILHLAAQGLWYESNSGYLAVCAHMHVYMHVYV